MISDYLSDRTQRVAVKSCVSSTRSVNAGVPQGSVLLPLLFLIYVNDIADSLLSLTRLFADDSRAFYFILLFYLILHRPTSTYIYLFIYLFIYYVYFTHSDRFLTMFYDIFVELLYEPCLVRIYLCIFIPLAAQISKTLLVSIQRNTRLSHTCT